MTVHWFSLLSSSVGAGVGVGVGINRSMMMLAMPMILSIFWMMAWNMVSAWESNETSTTAPAGGSPVPLHTKSSLETTIAIVRDRASTSWTSTTFSMLDLLLIGIVVVIGSFALGHETKSRTERQKSEEEEEEKKKNATVDTENGDTITSMTPSTTALENDDNNNKGSKVSLNPIGTIHVMNENYARIEVPLVLANRLVGLGKSEFVWVIFVNIYFQQSSSLSTDQQQKETTNSDTLISNRPVAMSLCKLGTIERGEFKVLLDVRGTDLMNGAPVLEIYSFTPDFSNAELRLKDVENNESARANPRKLPAIEKPGENKLKPLPEGKNEEEPKNEPPTESSEEDFKMQETEKGSRSLGSFTKTKKGQTSSETKLTEHANVTQKPIEKREVSTDGTSEPKEVEVNVSSHPVEPEAKPELFRHSTVEMATGSTRKTTEAQLEIVSNKFPTNEEHKEWFAQDSTKSQGSKHVSFEAEKKQLRITKPTTPPPLSQEVKIADTGITVSLKSRWPRGFPSQEEQQSEPCLEAALEKEEAAYDSGDELAILPTDEQDYGTLKDYWNKAATKRTPQGLDPEEELARSLSVKKFSKLTSSFTGAQKDEDIDTGIYMEDKDNE